MEKSAVRPQLAQIPENLQQLMQMYRSMVLIRTAEETLAGLLEQKEIGCPTHLYTGEEAVAVGICSALDKDDYVFGAHRSHGHYLAKGGDLRQMVAEIYGKTTGCARGRGGSMHLVAPEVNLPGTAPIVAATVPIAVGAALAARLRGDGRVSVSFFGDGAVEEGTVHESMNLAAVRGLPVLFVCENNFYSSHLHVLERRAKDNIVDCAVAHGMPGIRLDGNDVLAVYNAARQAVERARKGEGPTFLECRTYRWRGHVGASFDLDVGVKRRDELAAWRAKDPIKRMQDSLVSSGASADKIASIQREVEAEVKSAVDFARSSPFPDASELRDYVFSSLNRRRSLCD